MRRFARLGFGLALVVASPVVAATPAYAARTVTLSTNTPVLEFETITVTGSGYSPNAQIGICQAVDDGAPEITDCGTGTLGFTTSTNSAGNLTTVIEVRRVIETSGHGVVDCTQPASTCAVAVAEISDLANTAAFAPIAFAPPPARPATLGSVAVNGAQPFELGVPMTVEGSGFRSGAAMVVAECPAGFVTLARCADPTLVDADSSGTFSTSFTPDTVLLGVQPNADCYFPGNCLIVAAERVDVSHTVVSTDVRVIRGKQPLPDAQIRRRSDGFILGDNRYDPIRGRHPVDAGGKWVWALVVQNDGTSTDDITLRHFPLTGQPLPAGFTVRYFVGYYEITSVVQGSGFVLQDMAPGESRTIGVQLRAATGLAPGTEGAFASVFDSTNTGNRDQAWLYGTVA